MRDLISYLWQSPQNLLGLLLVRLYRAEPYFWYNGKAEHKVYVSDRMRGGISLGRYILIRKVARKTILHEYGHQIQSRRLGWLYLPTVGLVSGLRCGLHLYREGHYYDCWPESAADRLGGVVR